MKEAPITVVTALRDMSEAKRPKRVKGLFTPQQMVAQFKALKKEAFNLRQSMDTIRFMDQDVGPSMSDNSGKYFDESKAFGQAMDMIEKAIASAEKVKYDK
jgi:hypothetical protein|tara:strand:- start:557 stop:859 length:303 start_codon:yes stop_codon:yes gene_type:complete